MAERQGQAESAGEPGLDSGDAAHQEVDRWARNLDPQAAAGGDPLLAEYAATAQVLLKSREIHFGPSHQTCEATQARRPAAVLKV